MIRFSEVMETGGPPLRIFLSRNVLFLFPGNYNAAVIVTPKGRYRKDTRKG